MEAPLFEEPENLTKELSELGIDYKHLYSQGVSYLQQFSGANWTDFNVHDPGVTILEQLAYAITELTYRTRFDINNYLFDTRKDLNLFINAEDAFSIKPVTLNDLRKLIFDRIFEINNIWIEPVSDTDSSFKGIYQVLIDIDSNITSGKKKESIVSRVTDLLQENRNLCEDIELLDVIDVMPAALYADVEVTHIAEVEDVYAKILFEVEQALNPAVKVYSKQELINRGFSEDAIYEGPYLNNGFILNEELHDKNSQMIISDLIKVIMQIEGVKSVKGLALEVNNKKHDAHIPIPKNKKLSLINTLEQDGENINHQIHIVKEGMLQDNLNQQTVNKLLNEFKSVYKRNIKNIGEVENASGELLDSISDYHSIQHDFPALYGLGEEGVFKTDNIALKGQTKQLKAFLVLFEQMMANFLSQLANVKNLFSYDEKQKYSYFVQTLKDLPNLEDVTYDSDKSLKISHELLGDLAVSKNYEQGIYDINKLQDNYVDRKSRLMDFLLGVYGEQQTFYILSLFNYFKPNEVGENLLKSKAKFLRDIQHFHKNKSLAYNYTKPFSEKDNLSVIEQKLKLLIGVDDKKLEGQETKLASPFFNVEMTSSPLNNVHEIPLNRIEKSFDYIDEEDFQSVNLNDVSANVLDDILFIKKTKLPTNALTRGIDLDNYMLEHTSEGKFTVAFQQEDKKWMHLGEFKTEKSAVEAVRALIEFITAFNTHSEGFYLLEHVLLRPKTRDKKFGIYLLDEHHNKVLYSNVRFSYKKRDSIISDLESELKIEDNYSITTLDNKSLEISFTSKALGVAFKSVEKYTSVEETYKLKEHLFEFLSNKYSLTPYTEKIDFFIQNLPDAERIPEDFFNFNISLVLPDWTYRFGKPEFRNLLYSLVQEEFPAYLLPNVHWLSLKDMKKFENYLYEWRKVSSSEGINSKETKSISSELINILYANAIA